MFFNKIFVGGRRWPECGNLALFHRHFSIDPIHSRVSNIIVTWKIYEYVTMNALSSSSTPSKMIDLLEEKNLIPKFLEKFQNQIYKYIKHSHRFRWQAVEFKHSVRYLIWAQSYQ